MNEKQNRSRPNPTLMCGNCGGIKFLSREELSRDELIVAERTTATEALTDADGVVFCARCLYPARLPDMRA